MNNFPELKLHTSSEEAEGRVIETNPVGYIGALINEGHVENIPPLLKKYPNLKSTLNKEHQVLLPAFEHFFEDNLMHKPEIENFDRLHALINLGIIPVKELHEDPKILEFLQKALDECNKEGNANYASRIHNLQILTEDQEAA